MTLFRCFVPYNGRITMLLFSFLQSTYSLLRIDQFPTATSLRFAMTKTVNWSEVRYICVLVPTLVSQ